MPIIVTIVYESMFGSTRQVAESIANGIQDATVRLERVGDARPDVVEGADLLIVGAPTHAHTLSRPSTRAQAAEWAADEGRHLVLEPHATGEGVREWLHSVSRVPRFVAAFDTRADIPEIFSGAASRKIERALKRLGGTVVAERTSYLVDDASELKPGQAELARTWGAELSSRARRELDAVRKTP